ncbi:MAG: hypothetical protein Q9207_008164 [Kuettlingeria erythrocarpa]
MYFSLSSLTILSLAISALSAPIPDKLSARQAFVPKLTFIGADYRDYYYIDAPGDGTSVTITNPLSVSSISLGGGALCSAYGVDGSATTLTGTMTVPVGPPQRQSRLTSCMSILSMSAESTSLLNLPAEIWHTICTHINRSSLPSLRLVCRKLAEIAAPHLFRELYVNWLPRSISDITAVAAHPVLRQHVKRLVFELSILDPRYKDFQYWQLSCNLGTTVRQLRDFEEAGKGLEVDERVLQYLKKIELHGLLPNETDRRCIHALMANRLNEQEELLKDPQTREFLAIAVSSLIALEKITTTNSARYIDPLYYPILADVPAFLGEDEKDIERWKTLATCQQVDYLLPQPYFATRSDFPDLLRLRFALIARATGVAAFKVKALDIAASPAECVELSVMRRSEKCFQSDTCVSLRSITLRLFTDHDDSPTVPEFSQIARFLQTAVLVTNLQLEFGPHGSSAYDYSSNPLGRYFDCAKLWDVSGMMDKIRLPHLQSLEVHRLCITEDSFGSFMRLHAPKLRYIAFHAAHMKSPGDRDAMPYSRWQRAIIDIAPFMSMDHVHLGLIEDSWLSSRLRYEQSLRDECKRPLSYVSRRSRYPEYCRQVSAYLRCKGNVEYPRYEKYYERLEQVVRRYEYNPPEHPPRTNPSVELY